MGMISRVRGRIRSDSFCKDHTIKSKEKIANIVWLLSLVLLLPCWAPRGLFVALGGAWLMAAYTCLVLPVLISANYKYPASWYPVVVKLAKDAYRLLSAPAACLLRLLQVWCAPVLRAELLFVQMTNLSTIISQLVFFSACDRLLVSEGRLTCLYSLMFYNVVTYCVTYIRELVHKEDWSPFVSVTRHSRVKHLAMSATKIVLEWTKFVTFAVTVTFVLLALGLEQGLEHYSPTAAYTLLTATYYLLSERTFVELWPAAVSALHLKQLEGMEPLYVALWIRAGTAILSAPLGPLLVFLGRRKLAALLVYVCVWVHVRHRLRESWIRLREARDVIAPFRRATDEEIASLEDVCAVCLATMNSARATPCAHYFHSDCLRRCLAASDRCPICVRPFVFC